jgi:hypothetical protein
MWQTFFLKEHCVSHGRIDIGNSTTFKFERMANLDKVAAALLAVVPFVRAGSDVEHFGVGVCHDESRVQQKN